MDWTGGRAYVRLTRHRHHATGGLSHGPIRRYASTMLPSLLIIDDFLADPHGARAAALGLGYDPATRKGNYPGTLSSAPLGIAGLAEILLAPRS